MSTARSVADPVSEIAAAGAAAWPGVVLTDARLAERLALLFEAGLDASECLHPADLFLAIACAIGEPHALKIFEDSFVPNMMRSASHLFTPTVRADEVRQALRVKLLVRDEGGEGKLAQYTGRGPLAGWLRIVAVRTVLSLRRGQAPSTPTDDESLLTDMAAHGTDPELEHLRAKYQSAFESAFHDALMSLDVEGRTILRLHHVEGLVIDELAPLFDIHRATAARRLTKAREEVSERARALLVSRLNLSESECASILGMILSQLDVSIVRVLSSRDE